MPQRLPIVNSDDGTWGDIIRQFLMKEHYNDDTDNSVNGGHQKVTIRAGTATAGTAPLKFTSGTLMTTPEAGAIEFTGDNLYFTQTTGPTRKKLAAYDDAAGATGDIYYRNSTGYFTRLAAGNAGDFLTIASGIPSWTSTIVGATIGNTSTVTLKDTNFTLQDDGDTTKQMKFELSGITTATTRTLTVPNASTTLVGTDVSQTLTNKTLSTGTVISTLPTGSAVASASTASTLAARDANANLFATNVVNGYTSTVTSASTVVLSATSTNIQVFTGSTAQTVTLPSASIVTGMQYRIVNNSTTTVTVNASGGTNVVILAANTSGLFTALAATPTTNTQWDGQYWGTAVASGKTLAVSQSLTLSGTDGTTMTFPSANDTVAGIAATQTLTNKTISGSNNTLSNIPQSAITNLTTDIANKADVKVVPSGDLLEATTLNMHPESVGFNVIPNFMNDIAYNNPRGGSVAVTKNGVALTEGVNYTSTNWFTPDGAFGVLVPTATTDSFVITVTLHTQFQYGTYYGIVMADGFMAKDVTIEGFYSGAWTTIYTTTNNTSGRGTHWKQYSTNGANGITQLRYTLTNLTSASSLRITSLFVVTYSSSLGSEGFFNRGGGALYGTNAAPPAISASGSDTNISLNLVPKGTGRVTAGGVNVPTISSTDTLTNKTISGSNNTISGLGLSSLSATGTASSSTYLRGDNTWATITAGDASTNTATSVDSEVVLFNGTTGKSLKRATGTGIATLTSGVLSTTATTGSGNVVLATTPTITTPVLNGTVSGTGVSTSPTASTLALRDANSNLSASLLILGFTTTPTAAGTTTLTMLSNQLQIFTGTSTQTVVLPTTSVVAGTQFRVINNSTGAVTVQSSGLNTIVVLAANTSALFTALVATPTTAANWEYQYWASNIASGKTLAVNQSLTLNGTDGTTMTFPTTNATIARTDAAQTFTGVQTFTSPSIGGTITGTYTLGGTPTFPSTVVLTTGAQTLASKTLTTPTIADFTNATHTHTNAAGGGQLTATTALNATGTPSSSTYLRGDNTWATITAAGDASTNTATSVDGEVVLFNGTTGKSLKRATGSGIATLTSGVLSTTATTGSGNVVLATSPTLTTPVLNGIPTGTGVSVTPSASTLALRDANNNLFADNFIATYTSVTTAGTTTALSIASTQIQVFTGTSTQTVTLPSTSVVAGTQYRLINNSTGAVTVQSSAGNQITILAANTSGLFTALQAAPTANTHWDGQYWGTNVSAGKTLAVSQSITLAGTDGTTMTFPGANDTVVGLAAAQTLTNKNLTSGTNTFPTFNQNTTGTAAGFTGSLAGDVSGTQSATVVDKVKGVTFSAGAATVASQLNNASARSATATLTAGEETVFTGSTAGQTLTLPTTPQVSTINTITNIASVTVTLAPGGTNTLNYNGVTGNITIPVGGSFAVVFIGTTWYVTNNDQLQTTGSGSTVLATSPTLTTPNLGTPSAVTLTNGTGLPISTGVSGLATGIATFLATPSSANLAAAVTNETGSGALVFATSPTLTTPNLGTPSAVTLTNGTGLPISTGVSGLATGIATFLATPSSANLAAAVTDETGSGALVFGTSPTIVTPTIASFANAAHNHTNAAGGGQLNPTTALTATGTPSSTTYLRGDNTWATITAGDASTNTATAVDGEVVLFNGTTGKSLKRATGSGIATLSSGVLGTVAAPSGAIVGTTDAQTLTNKTLTNPTVNNYTEGVVAIGTVTTSSTLDLTNGTLLTATLTASTACTFTMPTATAGKSFILLLKQAASTGNGTASFTGVKWNGAGTPTMTPTAGKMDIFNFFADGTNWYGSYTQGYTP